MNRIIKFRAKSVTGEIIYFELRDIRGYCGDKEDLMYVFPGVKNGDTFMVDIKTLQQFTGLLDKNGKEIFEGDIFPCLYAFDGCIEHEMIVEYNEPRAGFFPRWDYSKCQQKGVEKTMHDLTNLEIIGNIYENPELLKN